MFAGELLEADAGKFAAKEEDLKFLCNLYLQDKFVYCISCILVVVSSHPLLKLMYICRTNL